MKEFLTAAWENARHALITAIALPAVLVAVIGAGLLHGALFVLDGIDPIDAEYEAAEGE